MKHQKLLCIQDPFTADFTYHSHTFGSILVDMVSSHSTAGCVAPLRHLGRILADELSPELPSRLDVFYGGFEGVDVTI